jgi:hypothetical protein
VHRSNCTRRRRCGRLSRLLVGLGIAHRAHGAAHTRSLLDAEARRGQVAAHLSACVQNERFARRQISFDLAEDVDFAGAHRAEHDAAFGDAEHPVEIDVSLHAANNF